MVKAGLVGRIWTWVHWTNWRVVFPFPLIMLAFGPDGAYRFRTIKPVAYPGRAPHIHFAISGPDFEPLITQLYVAGAPENERDFLLRGIPDAAARQRLIVAFEPAPGPGGERVAKFDVVLAADGRFGRRDREYERLQARG